MIPEKLMEELYTLIYHTDLDGFERIERAIHRIGLAYADGEMPLPGQRFYQEMTRHLHLFRQLEAFGLEEGDILIAFSPFPRDPCGTGVGKEEEE